MKTKSGTMVGVLGLVLATAATVAAAGDSKENIDTGNELLKELKTCDPNPRFTCGVARGRIGVLWEFAAAPEVCAPARSTLGQAMDVVQKFLQDHPERQHEHDLNLIADALKAAWPCSPKAVQKGRK
jgi:hypothetical protein